MCVSTPASGEEQKDRKKMWGGGEKPVGPLRTRKNRVNNQKKGREGEREGEGGSGRVHVGAVRDGGLNR